MQMQPVQIIEPLSALHQTKRMCNELDQLAIEAGNHPRGSLERQQKLTQLVQSVQRSGSLWRGGKLAGDYYEEALQQTWLHVCQRIETYDPQRASVITWINFVLKHKLLDLYRESGQSHDSVENLPGFLPPPCFPSPGLARIRLWVQQESSRLRRVHVRDRPDINCQALILYRLPPAKTWEQLSQQFSVPISTLSNFYSRECKPRLREFLDSDER